MVNRMGHFCALAGAALLVLLSCGEDTPTLPGSTAALSGAGGPGTVVANQQASSSAAAKPTIGSLPPANGSAVVVPQEKPQGGAGSTLPDAGGAGTGGGGDGSAPQGNGNDTDSGEIAKPPCGSGTVLGIWLDPNGDGDIVGDPFLGEIEAFTGEKTAAENYGYQSASAHPVIGPQPIKLASHVFFYEGPDGLNLTLFHNIEDQNEGGNKVQWDIRTTGNPEGDAVKLVDDKSKDRGDELRKLKESTTDEGKYAGRWEYNNNTDGGVIGPFAGELFWIKVKILSIGNVNDAAFYSADGTHFTLKDQQQNISSFVIGFKKRGTCIEGR